MKKSSQALILRFFRIFIVNLSFLFLYSQEPEPSDKLILLVKIVVNLYAPMILKIKASSHVSQGSIHYFSMLQLSRNLFKNNQELLENVISTLKWNGYWCHPESIILAMLFDQRESVKEKAIQLIQQCREEEEAGIREYQFEIRKFMVPKSINFEAETYDQLINLETVDVEFTSPPLLNGYSIEEIQSLKFKEDFQNIPCHSTTVERFVALTSIAAKSTIGQENRHGWLLNKVQSCEKISSHPTKEQFAAAASAKRKLYEDDEKSKKK